jgi:outer membrane protein assembly factor BamE (lipoprotein component of BamABCDE complex)
MKIRILATPLLVLALVLALATSLGGCSVFRLATVQGNVLEQKQVDQLEIGMTPEQVRFLLGTPLLQDSFDPNHWDYVYYYRSPKGQSQQRTLSLYFESGRLARIVGQADPSGKGKDAPGTNESLEKVEKNIDTKTPADSSTPESNNPMAPP